MTLRTTRTASLAALLLFLALGPGCSSSSGGSTPSAADDARDPLGLGYPDPQAKLRSALDAAGDGDLPGWLSHFAYRGRDGDFFVGGQERGEGDVRGLQEMQAWSQAYYLFSDPSFVEEVYGEPRSVANTPPTIIVPVTRTYRFDRVDEAKRAELLGSVNAFLPPEKQLDWRGLQRQMLNQSRYGELRFVYIDRDWRFDASWRAKP